MLSVMYCSIEHTIFFFIIANLGRRKHAIRYFKNDFTYKMDAILAKIDQTPMLSEKIEL